MNKSYIDLHIHSLYSDDGEFTPTQLVEMCYEAGVKITGSKPLTKRKRKQEN